MNQLAARASGPGVVGQVQAFLGSAGDKMIGALVFWTLSMVRVQREEFRACMEGLGLGLAVGRDPRPEALLAKAAQKAQVGRKDVLLKRLDRYRWAVLVGEVTDEGKLLKMQHQLSVVFENGVVGASNVEGVDASDAATQAAGAVLQHYIDASVYMDTAEVSEVLVAALQGVSRDPLLAGLSLRERSGGLYFIPGTTVTETRALAKLISDRRWGQFVVLTLHGDDENLETASMAAKASFTGQLQAIRAEMREFVQANKSKDRDATDHNLGVRLERLRVLQDRVLLFGEVLGSVKDSLDADIEAAKLEMAKELGL